MKMKKLRTTLPSLFLFLLAAAATTTTTSAQSSPHPPTTNSTTGPYAFRPSPLDNTIIALPTAQQLHFQSLELGVLIHFNIATYLNASLDGCNDVPGLVPSADIFQPRALDTDQWMDVVRSLGAKYATLVVKHNCGFALWPSQVQFQTREGEHVGYNYTTANAPAVWRGGRDIVAQFSRSARKAGVGYGYYYSTVVNNFLNVQDSRVNESAWAPGQVNVTDAVYDGVVLDQLGELWSDYGPLTEVSLRWTLLLFLHSARFARNMLNVVQIWFDGGYSGAQRAPIQSLLQTHQPQAVIFNGCDVNGTCVSPNSIRWIGTEAGEAPDPNWSTGVTNDGGYPGSPYFCPAECDTTLQTEDRWFWGEDQPLRSFEQMVDVYHKTVGRNCMLELDLAPDRSGLIPARHAARYKQLGDFIRGCYAEPVALGTPQVSADGTEYAIAFERPTAVDRVVLMEDQMNGQVIRKYEVHGKVVDAQGERGTLEVPWSLLSNGTSIGHKKIDLFDRAVTVTDVRVRATKYVDIPRWSGISLHLCDRYDRGNGTEEAQG